MDFEIIAAAALGCSFGLMFKMILEAFETNSRMKMMIQGALDNALIENENNKKKTQKK